MADDPRSVGTLRNLLNKAQAWVKKAGRKLGRTKHFINRHYKRLRHGRRHRKQLQADLDAARQKLQEAIAEGHDPGDPVLVETRKLIDTLQKRLDLNHDGNKKIRKELADLRAKRERRAKMVAKAYRHRRIIKRELVRALEQAQEDSDHFMMLDGKPIPEWIGGWLLKARAEGWDGILVSGYRTPEYSEQLCFNMCGAPSCPGMCAGRLTNHACPPTNTGVYHEGAADLSDYWNARAILTRIGSPLKNTLPNDPVHVSYNGN